MMRRNVAWGLAIVDVVTFVVVRLIESSPDYGALILYGLGIGSFVSVGALLHTRVPKNPIGALLLAAGTFAMLSDAIGTYVRVGLLQDPKWAGAALATSVGDALFFYPIMITLVLIPLVFPDGHLPSPRFRWVVAITLVGMVAWTTGAIFQSGLDAIVLFAMLVSFGGAATAISLRFKRGDPVERQQVKWFAAVVLLAAIVPVGFMMFDASPAVSEALLFIGILAMLGLPVVIGIAILRHRLYEIDRIVSRTIAYVVISAILVAAYVGLVIVIGGPLGDATGGETISVALSMLLVAALFQPLRRRVQSIVDRRFDRARIDADRTTAAFSERLRDQMDIETVTADLRETIHATVRPDRLGVWLREAGR